MYGWVRNWLHHMVQQHKFLRAVIHWHESIWGLIGIKNLHMTELSKSKLLTAGSAHKLSIIVVKFICIVFFQQVIMPRPLVTALGRLIDSKTRLQVFFLYGHSISDPRTDFRFSLVLAEYLQLFLELFSPFACGTITREFRNRQWLVLQLSNNILIRIFDHFCSSLTDCLTNCLVFATHTLFDDIIELRVDNGFHDVRLESRLVLLVSTIFDENTLEDCLIFL